MRYNAIPSCPRCNKSVYFAEEVKAAGQIYHKFCLKCNSCAKLLSPQNVNDHNRKIYCAHCHSKLYGTKCFGHGSTLVADDLNSCDAYTGDDEVDAEHQPWSQYHTPHATHVNVSEDMYNRSRFTSDSSTAAYPHQYAPRHGHDSHSYVKTSYDQQLQTTHDDHYNIDPTSYTTQMVHHPIMSRSSNELQPNISTDIESNFPTYHQSTSHHMQRNNYEQDSRQPQIPKKDHTNGVSMNGTYASHKSNGLPKPPRSQRPASSSRHLSASMSKLPTPQDALYRQSTAQQNRCVKCGHPAYANERVMSLNKVYHRLCFKCTKCNKLLDRGSVCDHDQEPFCSNCYNRFFGGRSLRTQAWSGR